MVWYYWIPIGVGVILLLVALAMKASRG